MANYDQYMDATRISNIASSFLGEGANVNKALDHNRLNLPEGTTLLHVAAFSGDSELVKVLIDHGADVNVQNAAGQTPIQLTGNAHELARLLLDEGADPAGAASNNEIPQSRDYAQATSPDQMIRSLIDVGANLGTPVKGDVPPGTTMLHLAAWGRDPELVTALLGHGVLPNARDGEGRTALHMLDVDATDWKEDLTAAQREAAMATARVLIDGGVDPELADSTGTTALALLQKHKLVMSHTVEPDVQEAAPAENPAEPSATAQAVASAASVGDIEAHDDTREAGEFVDEQGVPEGNAIVFGAGIELDATRADLAAAERGVASPERSIADPLESRLDNGLPSLDAADNPRIDVVGLGVESANDANARDAANEPEHVDEKVAVDQESPRLARERDRMAFERSQGKEAEPATTADKASAASRAKAGGQADGKGNEVKAAPIFRNHGYELPQSVVTQYVAFDGQFLHRKAEVVHFKDEGRKLSTDSNDKGIVRSMMDVAQAKNWGEVQLKGTEEFRRQAWIAAELAGIKSTGFKPNEQDRALLTIAREEMRISGAEKGADATKANTIGTNGRGPAVDKPAQSVQAAATVQQKPAERGISEAQDAASAQEKTATVRAEAANRSTVDADAHEGAERTGQPEKEPKATLSDEQAIKAARAAFHDRGAAIASGRQNAGKGKDVFTADVARIIVEQRIKGFHPDVQQRFRSDLEKQINEARQSGRDLMIPVPTVDRTLLEASRIAQGLEQSPTPQAEPGIPTDIDR
ncbi:LPD7 domain-containing protein [Paraburkholderia tropica]|uniref:LPD7 domain-containing protein n=1 Tax=Paraburkholderia tropica TaxID=92647 RepID=UPI002AB7273A|nr:LPD7 domain-containing protein [Paraburkholderia tropica]